MMLPPSCMQLANILGRFQWLTCPRKVSFLTDPISPHVKNYALLFQKCLSRGCLQDLSTGWLQCDPGPLFKPDYYSLHGWVPQWVSRILKY